MDALDKGILLDLLSNCRLTYEELSRNHGVSANAIRKRVLKLEETKVIDSYTVYLSPEMARVEQMFGLLQTEGSLDEVELVNRISQNPCIVAASSYTDGTYALVGEYTNTNELMGIGTHLRSLESVKHVEMHTVLQNRGGSMEMGSLHLRVLKCLVQDPRMSIIEITGMTGLTARRVRKILQEIQESKAIRCSLNLELGAASDIPFLIWLAYDQTAITPEEFMAWLWESYSLPLWQVYLSASEPVAICLFAVDALTELDEIVRSIRKNDFIERAKVTISTHHKYFDGPRRRLLFEMVSTI
ncbi:MAG: Lrp/AsnC family transcriptional regulator [Candidatus Thorarchaeota archaeon]